MLTTRKGLLLLLIITVLFTACRGSEETYRPDESNLVDAGFSDFPTAENQPDTGLVLELTDDKMLDADITVPSNAQIVSGRYCVRNVTGPNGRVTFNIAEGDYLESTIGPLQCVITYTETGNAPIGNFVGTYKGAPYTLPADGVGQ